MAEDGSISTNYYDRNRGPLLLVVGLLFGIAVVALGRLRGVAALVGLAISVAVLIWFIVPAIIAGRDAVLVALVGGGAIVLVSLYLAHGYTPLTHVAAVGAFAALALTTALSWVVVEFAHFTGLASEEAFYLLNLPDIDLNGLLLAGIVLGALGALDDVTVTQASAVWEVAGANQAIEQRALFDSGLRIGRDHIASTVNTLLLAYAGAAMPLLILYSLSGLSLASVGSSEVIAVEIIRTFVGSIGLVAAVPITTWLAATQMHRWMLKRQAGRAKPPMTSPPDRLIATAPGGFGAQDHNQTRVLGSRILQAWGFEPVTLLRCEVLKEHFRFEWGSSSICGVPALPSVGPSRSARCDLGVE